jgi:glycogen phosphorylase
MYPGKLQNKTNGVTPRRWLHCCNPDLSELISDTVGSVDEWISNMEALQQLNEHATDQQFVERFLKVKRANKAKLKKYVEETTGIVIPLDAMYDIQVKRIHEYKRQLLNILYVVHRYLMIKDTPQGERRNKFVPRVVMIGGKAAPGYYTAKVIIELINAVGRVVNNDPDMSDLLKVVFLPNYNVSSAQIIIPASELSQHISTAGTEASGTSNMKFVMNGCLIIGTMDGANVEISEEIGVDNMFIFGKNVQEVAEAKRLMYEGDRSYVGSRLGRVYETVKCGTFGGNTQAFIHLIDSLINGGDNYLVSHDFYSYVDAQERVDATYKDQNKWCRMAIEGIARSGKFSSDRTISEYAEQIWNI